jgi:hypothetical protein
MSVGRSQRVLDLRDARNGRLAFSIEACQARTSAPLTAASSAPSSLIFVQP